ncbi:MAG TPA: helix-turn-helix transcriptional regulator [Pelolinea sp.]|nr:helix-turn-helix transcriptional regulator [Pelolinea sp.]
MNEQANVNVEKLKQEMRRGIIVVAVMSRLQESQYGYALLKNLNDIGLEIGQDTLYPLLRRLEEQELLESEWRTDDPRPRRYYRLNQTGHEVFEILKSEWNEMEKIIRRIIDETE